MAYTDPNVMARLRNAINAQAIVSDNSNIPYGQHRRAPSLRPILKPKLPALRKRMRVGKKVRLAKSSGKPKIYCKVRKGLQGKSYRCQTQPFILAKPKKGKSSKSSNDLARGRKFNLESYGKSSKSSKSSKPSKKRKSPSLLKSKSRSHPSSHSRSLPRSQFPERLTRSFLGLPSSSKSRSSKKRKSFFFEKKVSKDKKPISRELHSAAKKVADDATKIYSAIDNLVKMAEGQKNKRSPPPLPPLPKSKKKYPPLPQIPFPRLEERKHKPPLPPLPGELSKSAILRLEEGERMAKAEDLRRQIADEKQRIKERMEEKYPEEKHATSLHNREMEVLEEYKKAKKGSVKSSKAPKFAKQRGFIMEPVGKSKSKNSRKKAKRLKKSLNMASRKVSREAIRSAVHELRKESQRHPVSRERYDIPAREEVLKQLSERKSNKPKSRRGSVSGSVAERLAEGERMAREEDLRRQLQESINVDRAHSLGPIISAKSKRFKGKLPMARSYG